MRHSLQRLRGMARGAIGAKTGVGCPRAFSRRFLRFVNKMGLFCQKPTTFLTTWLQRHAQQLGLVHLFGTDPIGYLDRLSHRHKQRSPRFLRLQIPAAFLFQTIEPIIAVEKWNLKKRFIAHSTLQFDSSTHVLLKRPERNSSNREDTSVTIPRECASLSNSMYQRINAVDFGTFCSGGCP